MSFFVAVPKDAIRDRHYTQRYNKYIPLELSRIRERYPVPSVDDADGSSTRKAAVFIYETIRSDQEIRER